jgi:hypothetical protein
MPVASPPVAKYLRVQPGRNAPRGELGGTNYRLPADTELETLVQEIDDAMTQRSSLVVEVEMEDEPLSHPSLILNCAQIDSVLVGETPEPDAQ